MAECIAVKRWAVIALLAAAYACVHVSAQAKSGALAGKLTDMQAHPLTGAVVVARNRITGAEARTTATHKGLYAFSNLAPGPYTLEALSPSLGRGQGRGIVVSPHHTARVRAALVMEPITPQLPASAEVAAPKALRLAPPPHIEVVSQPQSTVGLPPSVIIITLSLGGMPLPSASVRQPAREHLSGGVNRLALSGSFMVQVAIGAARSALRLTSIPRSSLLAAAHAGLATGDLNSMLTAEQIQSLPLPNRDWQSLITGTQPGADDSPDQNRLAPAGSRPASLSFDGVNPRLVFGATGLDRQSRSRSNFDGPIFAESAIRAVQLLSPNRISGSDRFPSGNIVVESRQGGPGPHGQLSLFTRQNLLQARNPLTQWVRETASAPYAGIPIFTAEPFTPSENNLRAGGGVGSRFLHGRVGWFASFDAVHRSDPAVASVRHPDHFFAQPSNDQMQVLAARLGLSSTDPVAEGLDAYSSMLEQLADLLGPVPRSSTRATVFGRVDWRYSDRQSTSLALTDSSWNSPGGGFTRASETFGSHSAGSYRGEERWLTGRWQASLTPNLMSVTQASFGHDLHNVPSTEPSAFEQAFNINIWGQLPQIVVDSRYGFTIGNPAGFGPGNFPDESDLQLRQQVDWAHGHFLLRSGLELGHSRDAESFLRNRTGTYHYSSIENFISDALTFGKYGISRQLNPYDQHNCDQTGRVWRDSTGQLHGLGYLPCYSSYTQTIGPWNWWVVTNDWAGYVTAQWQPARHLTTAIAMRWQHQQLPPPFAALDNPDLPLTQHTPKLGSDWAPRASLSWGSGESVLPVLHLGYGMFFSRIPNLTLLNALTQTGSSNGDLEFRMRPTDNLNTGGAPPFPYVLAGPPGVIVKPGAVEFAPVFRNGEVHQATLSLEESLPAHFHVEAGAALSLGRRLPISADSNLDPNQNPKTITYVIADGNNSGPLKASQITVPFYANWPSSSDSTGRLNANYQQVLELFSRANSTWQAASIQISRNGRSFTLRARYTYAHATDWNPDESAAITRSSLFDPSNFQLEYGPSNLDVRHLASGFLLWQSRFHMQGLSAHLANGWSLAATGSYRSGLPYTMRTSGVLPREYLVGGAAIVGLSYGMNGYGGDNRVYGVGRNTYRYQPTWKADLRFARRFDLGPMRNLEILAESFNLFNHSNITELETVGYTIGAGAPGGNLPTLSFLTGLKTGQTEFGRPLTINATDYYRPREIQFGVRMHF